MHLDRIEISGFKSFADKTVIAFDKGVTAVVGPNGSGKSNLSEAIKWVLGEQSAKSLRGKKMDDIIFAGSQTRKPTNVAEVTLVLNNEDHFLPLEFSEIQITRRFHRNGDSECFINKKPCRLKDIVNLLMDSGLGKDSFSIISQGKVETIFHNKPEERRGMFEEVAGVLKYKNRKIEASRKLDKTQEHLDRVEDILHEVEGQLKPLEIQKEKALVYKEKKAALSEIDVALIVAEIDVLHEQFQVAKQESDMYQQKIGAKQKDIDGATQQITQLKQSLHEVETALAQHQTNYVQLVKEHEQSVGQSKVLQERLAFSARSKSQQDETKYQKEQLIQTLTQQQKQVQSELKTYKETMDQMRQQVEGLEKEETLLADTNQVHVEKERERYIAKLQEQARLKNELIYVEKNLSTWRESLEKLEQDQQKVQSEYTQLAQEEERLKQILVQQEERVQTLLQSFQTVESDIRQVSESQQKAVQTLQEKQSELHRLEARYNSLKDLTDDYAGYYQGVREILKQKQHIKGLHGAVAELVKVPSDYTTAIDIALGASMQHVVVSDDVAAREAIGYLKKHRLGRATFLPLTIIKNRVLPQDVFKTLQASKGFIGVASQLITYDSVYETVVGNLLGQTIVAQDLESGTALAKKIDYRYRVVSLDGEVVHAGGSMTGGATKQAKQASILSRPQEIEQLQKQLYQLKDTVVALGNTVKDFDSSLTQKQQERQRLQQEGTQSRLDQKEMQSTFERVVEKKEQLHTQQFVSQTSLQQLKKDIEAAQTEQETLHQTEISVASQVLEAKQHIDMLNVSQEEKAEQLDRIRQSLQEKSTQLAVTMERVQTLQQQVSQLTQQIKLEKQSLEALSTEQLEHNQSREELHALLETHQQNEKDSAQKIKTLETTLSQLQTQKQETDAQLESVEASEREWQQTIQKLLQASGQLEAKISRFEVNLDNYLERLNQEYELTYEAAKQSAVLNVTIQEASERVRALKKDIEQLGSVNLDAIEEYGVVKERFEFMFTQQQDLIQAKDNLLSTMDEMDTEVKKRFSETFYAIKQQFEKTFPKLFGGGRATLELTDPDNLLDTGIEIIAQPPGKRLQNLSLLSGGEKAFTAIALLFAILEVKPVPFCLLDEVEAALDEANVGRYGRYLKEFVEQTQFIVITHRKGTMESADVLYGVTMQESGVSKLASVKFEHYLAD